MKYWKTWQGWMNASFMGASVSFWIATVAVGAWVFKFVTGG